MGSPTTEAAGGLVAVVALLVGCGEGARWPTASELPAGRRQPDGVVIDPVTPPPPVRDRATTDGYLVTLRTPLGLDRALATVDELFRRVVEKDGDGLDSIFTADAQVVNPNAPPGQGGASPARVFWQARFRRLDYTKLKGEPIFHAAELDIVRAEDARDAPPHPSIHADALVDGDVVIRVPILTTRLGADRLFGDEIVFWLRRDRDRYRIYRMLEDFQLN